MTATRLGSLVMLLALCACPSTALIIEPDENVFPSRRAITLEREAAESLEMAGWQVTKSSKLFAVRRGEGSHWTRLQLEFFDGNTFAKLGGFAKSGHRWNFFTLGIKGRANRAESARVASEWLESFRAEHGAKTGEPER